jgi:hypothetical protein
MKLQLTKLATHFLWFRLKFFQKPHEREVYSQVEFDLRLYSNNPNNLTNLGCKMESLVKYLLPDHS